MNQRDDYRDNERFERDQESNGGRGFHSSSHGFDDTRDRGYESGPQGRDRDFERWRARGDEPRYGSRPEGGRQWGRSDWDAGRRGQGSYRQDQGRGYDWERDRQPGRAP